MQNKNKLTLHTSLSPEGETKPFGKETPAAYADKKPKPIRLRSSCPSASERLFRNTAVACGLLLTVMALKNVDSPVANKITTYVKSAVSMDFRLPSSVGNLAFVQKLMPESALVFLNMTNSDQRTLPVKGVIIHEYTEKQPWTEYSTEANATVYSLTDGKVEACVQTEEGDITILIKNTDGTEYLYAFLEKASVQTGSEVKTGTELGTTGTNEKARLYYEVRKNGTPVDPKNVSEK
ncbi:MAG: peptidoglycan DD-metalloendopeptidase family protein [Clostridia bacterium]|nr:peptidoglycan DD-metalloendopeptidase family protein [Clostridia bacterium]